MIKIALAAEESLDLVKEISKIDFGGGFNINNIFTWSLGIGGIASLGIIIFGGILYITSAGNTSRQENAKDWIWAAIYGLILLAVGYLILYVINPLILGK